jgi:hypothetical protein
MSLKGDDEETQRTEGNSLAILESDDDNDDDSQSQRVSTKRKARGKSAHRGRSGASEGLKRVEKG